jgi:uncharacterized protein
VVTVNSLDGADVYDYSINLFRKWGIGSKGTNRGVLILLAIQDHRYRITVGRGLDSILAEGNVPGFGLEAVPFLKRGDYSSAALLMTSRVAHVIAEDAGVTLPAFDSVATQPTQQPTPVEPAYNAQTESASESTFAIAVFVSSLIAFVAYLLIRLQRRRQFYSGSDISTNATNAPVTAATTDLFMDSTSGTSVWNPVDTSSSVGDSSSSFGSSDSGGSFGGGDTSGGGAGGNW